MFSKKFIVSDDYIDTNGHLNEVGYYHYAGKVPWAKGKQLFKDDFITKHNIGPIIFETKIEFLKEIFSGETINITLEFIDLKENGRKFTRVIRMYNELNDLSAIVTSKGGFMNLKTRKVVQPPEEVYQKFLNN